VAKAQPKEGETKAEPKREGEAKAEPKKGETKAEPKKGETKADSKTKTKAGPKPTAAAAKKSGVPGRAAGVTEASLSDVVVVKVSGKFPRYMTLLSPAAGATGVSRRPLLKWKVDRPADAHVLTIIERKTNKEVLDKDLAKAQRSYKLTAKQALKPNTEYLIGLEAEYTKAHRASAVITTFTTGR